MRKDLRDVRDMLQAEGFRVERIELGKHAKFHLERDWVRFFIVVSITPSDKVRWLHQILKTAKHTFHEHRTKPAAGVSGTQPRKQHA